MSTYLTLEDHFQYIKLCFDMFYRDVEFNTNEIRYHSTLFRRVCNSCKRKKFNKDLKKQLVNSMAFFVKYVSKKGKCDLTIELFRKYAYQIKECKKQLIL